MLFLTPSVLCNSLLDENGRSVLNPFFKSDNKVLEVPLVHRDGIGASADGLAAAGNSDGVFLEITIAFTFACSKYFTAGA